MLGSNGPENRVKVLDIYRLSRNIVEGNRWNAQRAKFDAADSLRNRKSLATQQVDLTKYQRRKSRDVIWVNLVTLCGELIEGGVDVESDMGEPGGDCTCCNFDLRSPGARPVAAAHSLLLAA